MPSVPSATRGPSVADRRTRRRSAGCCAGCGRSTRRPPSARAALGRGQVDAVGEDRLRPDGAGRSSRANEPASQRSSAAWTWSQAPVARARSAAASSVSSEAVKPAWRPTIAGRPPRIARSHSARPARRALAAVPVRGAVAECEPSRPPRAPRRARTSSEPPMNDGDSWWSITAVTPRERRVEERQRPPRPRATSRRARRRAATRPSRGSRGRSAAAPRGPASRARGRSRDAYGRSRGRAGRGSPTASSSRRGAGAEEDVPPLDRRRVERDDGSARDRERRPGRRAGGRPVTSRAPRGGAGRRSPATRGLVGPPGLGALRVELGHGLSLLLDPREVLQVVPALAVLDGAFGDPVELLAVEDRREMRLAPSRA